MTAQNGEPRRISIEVSAKEKWQKTGVRVTPIERLGVKYVDGRWTINPSMGYTDANGIHVTAKPGYTCPGEREGKLIGRIGGHVFALGNDGKTPEKLEGELELCANDDMDGRYGAGFKDNAGSIRVEIAFHRN